MPKSLFKTLNEYIGYRSGTITVNGFYYTQFPYTRRNAILTCTCDCGRTTETTTKAISGNNRRRTCGYSCPLTRPDKKGFRDHSHKELGSAALGYLCANYRHWAKTRNKVFGLTNEQARELFIQDCYYCGRPPQKVTTTAWGDEFKHNGIDRIDNSKGYELDNCVTCCYLCNLSKHTDSKQEFITWIKRLQEYKNAV